MLGPRQEDGVRLLAAVLFGEVAVVELDEAMQGKVLLSGGEVDDESGWDVVEGVEFVGLAESDHVPD